VKNSPLTLSKHFRYILFLCIKSHVHFSVDMSANTRLSSVDSHYIYLIISVMCLIVVVLSIKSSIFVYIIVYNYYLHIFILH